MNSDTWKFFSDRVTAIVARFHSPAVANIANDTSTILSSASHQSPALGVIVGSSTLDILADDLSQGSDFFKSSELNAEPDSTYSDEASKRHIVMEVTHRCTSTYCC